MVVSPGKLTVSVSIVGKCRPVVEAWYGPMADPRFPDTRGLTYFSCCPAQLQGDKSNQLNFLF
jgi:hypothetical protein